MKTWWTLKAVKILVLITVGALALGLVVMLLWNALIPELFSGPVLTFWQAVGLLVLCHILLRGWGRWRYANGWRRDRWRHRFEEKLAGMTPEEREKFKEEWRRRCGPIPGEYSEKRGEQQA
jgi:membrane protein implicated in regulation of membrane protease activity